MTQSSPPETGLIEKAMKKVDEGKKQAVDGYNKLVAAANKFLEYAAILSPLIAAIAMRYIRNGLKALADALKKIIQWIDTTISRQVPILSLIIITVEEFWVKPVEEGYAEDRRSEIELPQPVEARISPSPEKGEAPPLRPAS